MFIQIKVIDIDDSSQCLKLFKSNSFIGFVIFVGLVCGGIGRIFLSYSLARQDNKLSVL